MKTFFEHRISILQGRDTSQGDVATYVATCQHAWQDTCQEGEPNLHLNHVDCLGKVTSSCWTFALLQAPIFMNVGFLSGPQTKLTLVFSRHRTNGNPRCEIVCLYWERFYFLVAAGLVYFLTLWNRSVSVVTPAIALKLLSLLVGAQVHRNLNLGFVSEMIKFHLSDWGSRIHPRERSKQLHTVIKTF
jgi:hypothetical protein